MFSDDPWDHTVDSVRLLKTVDGFELTVPVMVQCLKALVESNPDRTGPEGCLVTQEGVAVVWGDGTRIESTLKDYGHGFLEPCLTHYGPGEYPPQPTGA